MIDKLRKIDEDVIRLNDNANTLSGICVKDPHGINAWRTCEVMIWITAAIVDLVEVFITETYSYNNSRNFFEGEFIPETEEEMQLRDEYAFSSNKIHNEAKKNLISRIRKYQKISQYFCDGYYGIADDALRLSKDIDEIIACLQDEE